MSATEADAGGLREATIAVKGRGAFAVFKHEAGVHRVQRVPGHREPGPHPHLHRHRRGAARGRGRRRHDRPATTSSATSTAPAAPAARASTPPTRPCASPTCPPASSCRCRTRRASSRTTSARCACCARASTSGRAGRARRPRCRRPASRSSARATAPRRCARTTSPRTGSPTTASASRCPLREQVLVGNLDALTDALAAEERAAAAGGAVHRRRRRRDARTPTCCASSSSALTVRHDDVDMPREDLALFFASVSDRYGLSRLEYHSDAGATFSSPDGAEFVLRPAQMASCGGHRPGLPRGPRARGGPGRARPSSATASASIWVEDITLVAVWDVGDPEAAARAAGRQRPADRRGPPRAARGRRGVPGAAHLAPRGRGVARVRRRADALGAVEGLHPPGPDAAATSIADAAALREATDAVHEFLLGPLTAFMMARARR